MSLKISKYCCRRQEEWAALFSRRPTVDGLLAEQYVRRNNNSIPPAARTRTTRHERGAFNLHTRHFEEAGPLVLVPLMIPSDGGAAALTWRRS